MSSQKLISKAMFFPLAMVVVCLAMSARSLSVEGANPGFVAESSEAMPQPKKVIARIWHGRVQAAKADEYYVYLKDAGINKIEAIEGNLGAQVLRRNDGNTTEFTVISYWESVAAIKKFAGEDYEKAHFLSKDLEYLIEPEAKVRHFEVLYDGRK